MRHQAADEMHVARKPIEFGDGDRARPSIAAGLGEGGGELRAALERVDGLARLDLDMLGDDLEAFASANRATAARWASIPSPDRPCRAVETR